MFKKIILLLSLSLGIIFVNFSYGDALHDVFFGANGTNGTTSNSKDYQIITENKNNLNVQKKIQNTTQLLLKLTIIIGVAVILFGGIRFMLSMGDDSKAKKIRDNIIISILGFVIAFGAWIILQLILSAGTTISHI